MGRQPELDLAKGFAIVFMVWTHVFEELAPNADGALATLVRNILGGPFAAPIFMICLGIGICHSKHNAPKDLMHRGISLLKIGLLLNVFRYVIPDLIKYAITNNIQYLYDTFALFSVDILQFAGLAFLFLAAAKKLELGKVALLLIGVAASILGTVLRYMSTGNYVIDQFLGFLWGTKTATFFPFLNWIIFPIIGMVFGALSKRCKDKAGLYLRVTPLCAGIMLVYLFFTIYFGFMFISEGAYYFLGVFDAMFFIILAVMVFGCCYALQYWLSKLKYKFLMRVSKNINVVFCVHWTIIGWLGIVQLFFMQLKDMQFWQVTLLAAIILFLTDQLTTLYVDKIKPKIKKLSGRFP
jgi:uncharacterized membrane protein